MLANFIGIFIGFIIYKLARPANQLAIQLSIGAILSIVLFLGWILLIHFLPFVKRLILCDMMELIGTGVTSLVWTPIIFVPLHSFTQGYLTAAGNIVAMLLFQLPVNLIVVVVIAIIANMRIISTKER
jgi:hypothetical protein